MQKLRNYLDEHKIKWRDKSDKSTNYWMCRTKFEIGSFYFSVINGVGSYGGFYLGGVNEGLLECMINGREPKGWLRADEVIKMVKKCAKK